MKLLVVLVFAITLIGCNNASVERDRQPLYQRVEILELRRPKHFRVTYRNLDTGDIGRVSSKHCTYHNNLQVGKRYVTDVSSNGCSFAKYARPLTK